MRPKAVRTNATARDADGLLRVEEAGRECVLDPLAELIWELADGSRGVEALAQAAGRVCTRPVSQEEVFSALDFLADAGLVCMAMARAFFFKIRQPADQEVQAVVRGS